MSVEFAILRAYALATQGKYEEAEATLNMVPGALGTPSGVDLLARIRFEQGDEDSARHIWEQILRSDPTNESAKKALAALDNPPIDEECGDCFCRRWKYALVAALAVLIGVSFSIGKACGKVETIKPQPTQQESAVIAELALDISEVNGKVLDDLRNGIFTNMTDDTVLVVSGGRGKYAIDRVQNLAAVTECINFSAGIPFQKMAFQIGNESTNEVVLSILRKYRDAP